MRTTDYPKSTQLVDDQGRSYRLEFRASIDATPTVGQLVAVSVAVGDTESQPIELTNAGVLQADVDTALHRWADWHSTIRSGADGFYTEVSLAEARRRLANAGLRSSTEES